LQAITKVKSAIHGHNNIRFNDLEYMVEFTHTGDLGKIPKIVQPFKPYFASRKLPFSWKQVLFKEIQLQPGQCVGEVLSDSS
jgi:hypothetical protein